MQYTPFLKSLLPQLSADSEFLQSISIRHPAKKAYPTLLHARHALGGQMQKSRACKPNYRAIGSTANAIANTAKFQTPKPGLLL